MSRGVILSLLPYPKRTWGILSRQLSFFNFAAFLPRRRFLLGFLFFSRFNCFAHTSLRHLGMVSTCERRNCGSSVHTFHVWWAWIVIGTGTKRVETSTKVERFMEIDKTRSFYSASANNWFDVIIQPRKFHLEWQSSLWLVDHFSSWFRIHQSGLLFQRLVKSVERRRGMMDDGNAIRIIWQN